MKPFNFFKRQTETTKKTYDYQVELAKIIAIYETYPVFPYISYEEGIKEWIQSISEHPELIIKEEYMTPNEDDFLLGDMLLLQWIDGCSGQLLEFPAYFERTYGINPISSLNDFNELGYLEHKQITNDINFTSLADLNTLLIEHGLPRQENIKRALYSVHNDLSADIVYRLTNSDFYSITPKGQELIKKYLTPPE